MSKRIAPLTQADIEKLKKNQRIIMIVMGVFMGIVALFSLTTGDFFVSVFIVGFMSIVPIIAILVVNSQLKKDLRHGTKRVFEGIVSDKRIEQVGSGKSSRTYYYFVIDNDSVKVTWNEYRKINTGTHVEVGISDKTETLLDVKVLSKSPATTTANTSAYSQQRDTQNPDKPYEPHNPYRDVETQANTRNQSFDNPFDIPNLVLMQADEMTVLKYKRNWTIVLFVLLWGVVGLTMYGIALGFATLAVMMMYGQDASVSEAVTILLKASIAGFIGWMFSKRIGPYFKDISDNLKQPETAIVTDKVISNIRLYGKTGNVQVSGSAKSPYYYLMANQRSVRVSPEIYNHIKTGDHVKLYFSPRTRVLLSVETTTEPLIRFVQK